MKKKILLLCLLTAGFQASADAQLLKKIGKALDKVANAAEALTGNNKQQSTTQTNGEDKQIGQPIQIGPATLTLHGDNLGVGFRWIRAERIKGSTAVTLRFQLENQAGVKLGIGMGEGYAPAYILDQQGNRYAPSYVRFAGMTMQYAISGWLAPDATDASAMQFGGVPTTLSTLQMAYIGVQHHPENSGGHQCSFRLKNVPISLLPIVNAKGVFGEQEVRVGQTIASLPKTFGGLYDAYTITKEEDEGEVITTVNFTLGGRDVMTAISNDERTIANIDVSSADVYVLVNQKYYTCGSRMANLKFENGVQVDEDYGQVSYQGMYFDEDIDGNICTIHI